MIQLEQWDFPDKLYGTKTYQILKAGSRASSDMTIEINETAGSHKRILIVDDNEDFAHGLAAILESMGHQACVTYSGSTALERSYVFAPDVVILDFDMPEMNGGKLAEVLRETLVGRSLLVICASGGDHDSLAVPFDFYLQKPIDYQRLAEILNKQL